MSNQEESKKEPTKLNIELAKPYNGIEEMIERLDESKKDFEARQPKKINWTPFLVVVFLFITGIILYFIITGLAHNKKAQMICTAIYFVVFFGWFLTRNSRR